MARDQNEPVDRDRYRDNDDERGVLEGEVRTGGSADTKSEARGDAREHVGNNARGTDTNVTGPAGNDRQKGAAHRDEFDDTLDSSS